jgi:hypothetical protein
MLIFEYTVKAKYANSGTLCRMDYSARTSDAKLLIFHSRRGKQNFDMYFGADGGRIAA